ncbi:hypothetical protein JAAARDRAFT_31120 [Jaapia argillacea MUCL 33604]|uniref:Ubiquitin carboxyl-terminal hydrolase n=1 Tax=Jaapia argillacea MUCL 33604 TaxID=933084 RepID=A0A067QGA7_9AGAM|nr:hypothetical protein JAAARDRAFT_31120 [Jaapia argillacea MUCL 33604]
MPSARWIPLESNPEVLNSWANKAGLVASQAQFEDVYGLDPELLGMVSRPVNAVVLLFPITDRLENKRKQEDAEFNKPGSTPVDPTIFFIKQTISNACGTIGLLHALINSNVTIKPESPLAKFIDLCQEKTPEQRAQALETTPLFADIHAEAAQGGQSAVPRNLDTDLHFTCFVQAPPFDQREETGSPARRLIELDGRRAGPLDRGPSDDLLMDVAKFVKEEYIAQSSSMNFSMMALGPGV